jgi:hypothetical protein
MLVSSANNLRGDMPAALDSIHNYYQQLVFEQITKAIKPSDLKDVDYIADIACVALNHLPPKYIRHDVDMAFYLSTDERAEMGFKVASAVEEAVTFVNKHSARL